MAQLAVVAYWAAGDRATAVLVARRLGTSRRLRDPGRRNLARLLIDLDRRSVAAEILDASRHSSPATQLLQARIDLPEGRLGLALERARTAQAAGLEPAASLVSLVEGRIAALSLDWEPPIDASGRARLERLRGSAVKGRILHLLFASLPHHSTGYSVRTQSIARCQREAGLDPWFATRASFPSIDGVQGTTSVETVDGVTYHRLAPDFVHDGHRERMIAETMRAAVPLIEEVRPAALQPASDHVQAQIALALGRPLGVPVVYEVRGFWEESWASHAWHEHDAAIATDYYRMTREIETQCMVAADAVVTLSESMRAEIVARGAKPENVVVIPNAVEVERFQLRPRDDALAASLGIGPHDSVVGYISTFNRYEGIAYLLDAAARLRDRGRPVRVLLVGDGPERAALVAAGRRLGIDDGTLIMTGRVPHADIQRYYSLLDVFVVPRTSHRVSQLVTPLKPYEAMAMERAVVVSDVTALREIVTEGETGLMFRAEDPADLADVLERLVDDASLRTRLGRSAREWVRQNRTWSANGRRYRELYERLGAA
jgi:PEP-CTERM/exosortase A-associated glycosyltransferase